MWDGESYWIERRAFGRKILKQNNGKKKTQINVSIVQSTLPICNLNFHLKKLIIIIFIQD